MRLIRVGVLVVEGIHTRACHLLALIAVHAVTSVACAALLVPIVGGRTGCCGQHSDNGRRQHWTRRTALLNLLRRSARQGWRLRLRVRLSLGTIGRLTIVPLHARWSDRQKRRRDRADSNLTTATTERVDVTASVRSAGVPYFRHDRRERW